MAKRIVVCGADQALVATRVAILKQAGYEVAGSTKASAGRQMIEPDEAELLILCSSLSRYEQCNLLDLSHYLRPGRKSLVVTAGNTQSAECSSLDIPFKAVDGPKQFVICVKSMLAV